MSLDLGMEIEGGVPNCCYGPMDGGKPGKDGHRVYTCGDCGTVVEVDELGLVWDIREKAGA
ncbi:hypothetical protein ACWD25_17590 [Streptomyces sp. NPDC002920]